MKLYENYSIDENFSNVLPMLDYFIVAANCDKRAYSTLSKMLLDSNISIGTILLFDYDKLRPQSDDDDKYGQYMSFEQIDTQREFTHIRCTNSDDDIQALANSHISDRSRVGVDITGFTIPDIFRIMYILKEIKQITLVYVFYAEPQQYFYKDGIFDTYELLAGESTYSSVPEYHLNGDSNEETFVCFLGFDRTRAKYMHDKANPSATVFINGFPSYLPKYKDISLVNNYDLLRTVGTDNIYFTKANNPFAAFNVLCKIREKHKDSLLNICVLGTKPMALGACMFSLKYDENLKVTYPYPKEYAKISSDESQNNWCYVINF